MSHHQPFYREDETRELRDMLTYMRPEGSEHEEKFIRRFIEPLKVRRDEHGNLIKRVGKSRVVWSSHTDTVHYKSGRQFLNDSSRIWSVRGGMSNCLGADDTAGVWLMIQMIRAKVPGVYVFHRGEEIGCQGSKALVKSNPSWLKDIKYVIAFDRRGTDSIVTVQAGYRTASDRFALSLAGILGGEYRPDPTGVFTDSIEYAGVVPECTNISVGYRGQHGKAETQDVDFLLALRDVMVSFDESRLVCERKPTVRTYAPAKYKSGSHWYPETGKTYTAGDAWWLQDDDDQSWSPTRKGVTTYDLTPYGSVNQWPDNHKVDRLEKLVRRYPHAAAQLLAQCGIEPDELMEMAWADAK